MSGKLLHEKLREWASNRPFSFNEAWEEFGVAGNDNMLAAFADEIERQYVPVPRFTDGTRVEMGCKVEGGTVGSWSVLDDRSWLIYDNLGRIVQSGGISDFAKRPEPDSLERLRDDIAEWRADVAIPGNGWDIKTAEWCDRLTALMERDKR